MNKEYLTVKEFADAAKISQQAVYKQISSRLKPYISIVGNQKMIHAAALEKFYPEEENDRKKEVEQPVQPDTTPDIEVEQLKPAPDIVVEQPIQPKVAQPTPTDKEMERTQQLLEDQIKELQSQMKEIIKNQHEEKEFLRDQIKQKDKQIESLTDNLKMAQQLAAADKKKLLELEAKQQEYKETVVDPIVKTPAANENINVVGNEENTQEETPAPKKSFFARLFGL